MIRFAVSSFALSLAIPLGLAVPLAGPAAAQGVPLAPHRAVYDLTLVRSEGTNSVSSARGRIAFDFIGDACTGWALTFRQVTEMTTQEGNPRVSDFRNTTFEEPGGKTFRFKSEHRMQGAPNRQVDGEAALTDKGRLAIAITRPARDRAEMDGADLVFPTEHLLRILAAAKAGQTSLSVRVFDGAEDGKKVYDTLALIGKRIAPGDSANLEPAAKVDALTKLARWPVSISYYAPGEGERTPAYTLAFDLYENGVSRALKIDYGSFVLAGAMSQLDLLPAKPCAK